MPAVVEDPCRECGHSLTRDHRRACGCCTVCACSGDVAGPLSQLEHAIATIEQARVGEMSWAALVRAGKVLARHIKAHDHCDRDPISCNIHEADGELNEIGQALDGVGDPGDLPSARVRELRRQRDNLRVENGRSEARVRNAVRQMRDSAAQLERRALAGDKVRPVVDHPPY